ncbi:MAG TPA: hypothetical protein VMS40_03435 [Vicinamibacterales bacterium]|nr:hypothetical protein [Vicinamibacterales bacterium]
MTGDTGAVQHDHADSSQRGSGDGEHAAEPGALRIECDSLFLQQMSAAEPDLVPDLRDVEREPAIEHAATARVERACDLYRLETERKAWPPRCAHATRSIAARSTQVNLLSQDAALDMASGQIQPAIVVRVESGGPGGTVVASLRRAHIVERSLFTTISHRTSRSVHRLTECSHIVRAQVTIHPAIERLGPRDVDSARDTRMKHCHVSKR